MKFIGRKIELNSLISLGFSEKSKLTVVYGRRRVGKSTLIFKAFEKRKTLAFEGLEGESTAVQKREFLSQLNKHLPLRSAHEPTPTPQSSWSDILIHLSKRLHNEPVVVLFDEFQWIAAERKELVSHLKYVWDNYFLKKNRIHLILCGSISSFLVKKVLRSRALYGRIDLEIHLKPIRFIEVKEGFFVRRSLKESLEAYLCVGGVPSYLELFDEKKSLILNLQQLGFHPQGYLFHDFEKIFTSHFGKNPLYRKIIMNLADRRFMTRHQIISEEYETSGGRVTEYLEELILADFIEKYQPLDREEFTKLCRYQILDNYLQFYFRFLFPQRKKIEQGYFLKRPPNLCVSPNYRVWIGLAFERFCSHNHDLLAEKLGFSAVDYQSGSYFRREDQKTGYQVDLLFLRADRVMTLCEVKYQNRPIGKEVIASVQKKIESISLGDNRFIEPVLVTASLPTKELINEGFFTRILTLEDIF